jgi:serine/threonine-protein kinase HipA
MPNGARVKRLELHTTQGDAGSLLREAQFVARYDDEALQHPERAISLTMPPRPDGYRTSLLTPVLAMNLPEGFLYQRIVQLYGKTMDLDDMNLLALTSTPYAGRVWASLRDARPAEIGKPIALREILTRKGTEALFDDLLEHYSLSISGVQPKVIVPEAVGRLTTRGAAKTSIKSPDLIVKAAGEGYPGLAENEYICMRIARHVGLETPEFWLSDDRKLFVIRRFDVAASGYLGFEDMAALTGRHPSRKYEGSYGMVAKAIGDFVASIHRAASLEAFFRLVVLCCVVRNGDAHLKNFGVLYQDPSTADRDARLSPVYDVVSTTPYLPKDVLALSLGGTKTWPDHAALARFGNDSCGIARASHVVDEVIDRAITYRHDDPKSAMWKRIRNVIEDSVRAIRA